MRIKSIEKDGIKVLIPSGSLEYGDPDSPLVTVIADCLDKGYSKFVIDLGKVKYFYSTELGSLLAGYQMVTEKGGSLVLARSTRKINSVMVQTQLVRFFTNFDSVKEALDVLHIDEVNTLGSTSENKKNSIPVIAH